MRITIRNRNTKRKIDLSKVRKAATAVLEAFKKDRVAINIVFSGNAEIRILNREHLGHDTATDVLAFPAGEAPVADPERSGKRTRSFLGDVIISSDKAAEHAKIYGTASEEEIIRYVIHGILHLLGYKDNNRKNSAAMRKKENEFLRKTGKQS